MGFYSNTIQTKAANGEKLDMGHLNLFPGLTLSYNDEGQPIGVVVNLHSAYSHLRDPSKGTLIPGIVGVDEKKGLFLVITKPKSKPIRVRAGKFLKRMKLGTEIVNQVSKVLKDRTLNNALEVKFTTTSEEVLSVYARGPHSCMKNCASVRVYATPDVSVAYLETADENVIARAVVCTDEELGLRYSKTYGEHEILSSKLEELGYERGDLSGCRILRIVEAGDSVVMPFIDGFNEFELEEGCEEYIVLNGGEYAADSTSGYLFKETCVGCGDTISSREHGDCPDEGDEWYCNCCFEDTWTWVDSVSGYMLADECGTCSVSYETFPLEVLEECEVTGILAHTDHMKFVEDRDGYVLSSLCMYNSYTELYHCKEDLVPC